MTVGGHTFESSSVPVVAIAVFLFAGPATWESPASDSDLFRFDTDEDWTMPNRMLEFDFSLRLLFTFFSGASDDPSVGDNSDGGGTSESWE